MKVYDRVHGELTLPPFVAAIATHKLFHRLDFVRQLGGCAFVYPSATHTRREHSIGVSYLAGKVGLHLKSQYPNLVDDDDVLCLQVAGLVHDLGHGPFSHTFEEYMHKHVPSWSHEDLTCTLFRDVFHELIVEHNPFRSGTPEQQLRTIQSMIRGVRTDDAITPAEYNRFEHQRFLFEIVHNQRTGIDVDKWDYLCRDSLCVFGASRPLNLTRLVGAIRLNHMYGYSIAFDEKVAFELTEMFALRARLHRQVYQHHGVIFVESLLVDLMLALDQVSAPRDQFHVLAQDKNRFTFCVDASILNHPLLGHETIAPIYNNLLHWTKFTRTQSTILLHTRPLCARCNVETELRAAFCTQCGASTKDRKGSVSSSGVEVTPAFLQTSETLTTILQGVLRRDDVRIHVRDIKCGHTVVVEDPHGRQWLDYDPLRCVAFVGKDHRLIGVDAFSHHAPSCRHVRTAYCFVLNVISSKEELAFVDAEFANVCKDFGVREASEVGTTLSSLSGTKHKF